MAINIRQIHNLVRTYQHVLRKAGEPHSEAAHKPNSVQGDHVSLSVEAYDRQEQATATPLVTTPRGGKKA